MGAAALQPDRVAGRSQVPPHAACAPTEGTQPSKSTCGHCASFTQASCARQSGKKGAHARHMKCVCVLHQGRASSGGGTCVLQPSRPLLTKVRHSRHTNRGVVKGDGPSIHNPERPTCRGGLTPSWHSPVSVDRQMQPLSRTIANTCRPWSDARAVQAAVHWESLQCCGPAPAPPPTNCSLPPCLLLRSPRDTPHTRMHLITLMLAGLLTVAAQLATQVAAATRSHLYTSTNHIRLTERAAQSANPEGTCSRGQCRDPGKDASWQAGTHMPPT